MGKIINGDTVVVTAGKDRGKIGNVLQVISCKSSCKVIVSGVNIKVKHQKPKMNAAGSIKKVERHLDVSNVALYCKAIDGPSKVYYAVADGEKVRKYRKTNEVVG